jgi:hypothetical protein
VAHALTRLVDWPHPDLIDGRILQEIDRPLRRAPPHAGRGVVTAAAAISAKTTNLPAHPAAVGDAMTLDMTQSVPTANASQTVGDAVNGARVNAFGNWVLLGNTYTLYAPDGVTAVHSLTVDNVNNPTSRV